MQVDFYQLTRDPAEKILPALAAKILGDDARLLVVSENGAQLESLSAALWNSKGDAFLANGIAGGNADPQQPTLLSGTVDAVNQARFIAMADGIWRDEAVDEAGCASCVADSDVGFRGFTERFATRVLADPGAGRVTASLVRGPFKALVAEWLITRVSDNVTDIKLSIDYEFKSSQTLSNGIRTSDFWTFGAIAEFYYRAFTFFANVENIFDYRQTRQASLISAPNFTPQFTEVWAPLDGLVFNFGLKIKL